MRWSDRERFTKGQVDAFLSVLGISILACGVSDALLGAWQVQAGALFPWRHPPGIPLFGRAALVLEWALGAVGGALLVARRARDWGVRAAIAATAIGLSQRFSNHRALLLIVLVFVALAPVPSGRALETSDDRRPALALVRAQLLLVYAFSVLNKIANGFLSGDALTSLFAWRAARPLSWGLVAAEIAVPVLLVARARWGIAAAVALHVSMAVVLPSVWPFSLTMVAMALLFAR